MWAKKPLGEVCDVLDKLRKPISKRDRTKGCVPYYGATGIVDWVDGFIFNEKLVLVGEDGAKWKSGDKTAFIIDGKAWVNNHAHVIRPHDDLLTHEWLNYYLISIDLSPWVNGAVVPKLNQAQLRSIPIPLPPLAEQQRIVAKLEAGFTEIDSAIHASLNSINHLKALSSSNAKKIFEALQEKEPMRPIADVCEALFAGGDAPKDSLSDDKEGKFQVPIYANAMKNKGLYGYTENARVHKPSVTVAGRGSGTGYTEIRYEPFLPIVRLIVLTPNDSDITVEFLKHAILNLEVLSSGAAIPQLTVPMIKSYEIPVPQLDEQRAITEKLDSVQKYVEDCIAIYKEKLELLASLKSALLAQELQQTQIEAA